MTVERPTLHDPGTASRQELVEHVKDQRRFIKFLEGQITEAEELIGKLRRGEILGEGRAREQQLFGDGGGLGDLMDGFFGKGGKP